MDKMFPACDMCCDEPASYGCTKCGEKRCETCVIKDEYEDCTLYSHGDECETVYMREINQARYRSTGGAEWA